MSTARGPTTFHGRNVTPVVGWVCLLVEKYVGTSVQTEKGKEGDGAVRPRLLRNRGEAGDGADLLAGGKGPHVGWERPE